MMGLLLWMFEVVGLCVCVCVCVLLGGLIGNGRLVWVFASLSFFFLLTDLGFVIAFLLLTDLGFVIVFFLLTDLGFVIVMMVVL